MTPEQARTELVGTVFDVMRTTDKDVDRAVVDAVLSDVPLLMQAVGAKQEHKIGQRVDTAMGAVMLGEDRNKRRWVTRYREADDE